MNKRIILIAYICIFCTLGCKKNRSFNLGISTYSLNHKKIDSISSYYTLIIGQSEHLLNVSESDFLRNDDYCFRFWIGHSLGLNLYCIELLQFEKNYYLSLATFSKTDTGYFKVVSVEPNGLKKADILQLKALFQEQRIKNLYKKVSSGIGESGADGAWIYFQYFSPTSLKLMPIDCYECLADDEEGNREIFEIKNMLLGLFNSNFSGYIEDK